MGGGGNGFSGRPGGIRGDEWLPSQRDAEKHGSSVPSLRVEAENEVKGREKGR